jgi:hypothetical protein
MSSLTSLEQKGRLFNRMSEPDENRSRKTVELFVVIAVLFMGAGSMVGEARGNALCKVSDVACMEDRYLQGTELDAAVSTRAVIDLIGEGAPGVIICSKGSINGETTATWGLQSVGLAMEISTWTFDECEANELPCTATAKDQPFEGALFWASIDKGMLILGDGGKDAPRMHFFCESEAETIYIDCTYILESDLEFLGGDPAHLIADEASLGATGSNCPSTESRLTVDYAIEAPQPAYPSARDVADVLRDGSGHNANFDIDGVDDYRVDADVAYLVGPKDDELTIDCLHPDPSRELFEEKAPYESPDPKDPNWHPNKQLNEEAESPYGPYGCVESGIGEVGKDHYWAGTLKWGILVDGAPGWGLGGTVPGVRGWAIRVTPPLSPYYFGWYRSPLSFPESPEYDSEASEYLPELGTNHVVAGIDWVADHADQIEVAYVATGCFRKGFEVESVHADGECEDSALLEDAVTRAIDKGVVVSTINDNQNHDYEVYIPNKEAQVLTVSNVIDTDSKPGGLGTPVCEHADDQRLNGGPESMNSGSDFGLVVDIAVPGCGDAWVTSKIAGAAAALASQCPSHDRAGVEFIADTLMAEGDTGEIEEGGWLDDSGDGWKEPLLNLSDEEVFDPVLLASPSNEEGKDEEPDPDGCDWKSHQAQSDVDSDGRADLVALDHEAGAAETFAGEYEGPELEPRRNGYEADTPTVSLDGEIDPALTDGAGQHAIDSADVNGDRHADLVTTAEDEGLYIYQGEEDGSFGEAVSSLEGTTFSLDGPEGVKEPIAAADVDGDERADLIAHDPVGGHILTYPGQEDGSFGSPVLSTLGVDSALLDGKGSYFLDVVDVTGEELDEASLPAEEIKDWNARHSYADLVVFDTDGTVYVYPGQGDGTFGGAIEAAEVDPVLDDGEGEEPVGLGDVDRDRRADLLTLDGEELKLYLGRKDGSFEESEASPYDGDVDSSLLDGEGEELVGLLDYSRDGLADLVSVDGEGAVLTYTAQRDKTFADPVAEEEAFPSVRQDPGGHELVAEKPALRRAGCTEDGCRRPTPIAAYSFEEGAGATLPDSAGDHDGQIEGASWSEAGKYGSALDFDGEDDLVEVADAAELDLTGSFTLEAWVSPRGSNNASAIAKVDLQPSVSGYQLSARWNGTPQGFVADSNSLAGAGDSTALPAEDWSHVAFTSDGTTLRLYIDGELKGADSAIAAGETDAPLEIGHNPFGDVYFDGLIDEVRIYEEALSQGQVEVDMEEPLEGE